MDPNSILLVDDEFDIVTIFKLGLENQGFKVFAFAEPLLALEHFQKEPQQYGLVISDLRMPEMNGYDFIKRVKELNSQVKVFFLTAFEIDDLEIKKVLPNVKIDEFIHKPILLKDLTIRIRKHIDGEAKTTHAEHHDSNQ